jgi:hypothetical protein
MDYSRTKFSSAAEKGTLLVANLFRPESQLC